MSAALCRLTDRLLRPHVRNLALRSRMFSTTIPLGASPQLLVSAIAPHQSGSSSKIAEIIFEHGASIAGTKKITLANHGAIMIAVWSPPTATTPEALKATLISDEVTARLGFNLDVKELTPEASAESSPAAQRRLKLICPQRPGLVLAITELLKDHSCKMSAISADTMAKAGEIWFEIEAIVEIPPGVDVSSLEAALRFWTESNARTELILDSFVHNASPLSHA